MRNKQSFLFVLPYTPGAIKLSTEQAKQLFSDTEIAAGECRGEMHTSGPWQLPRSYKALCTSNTFGRDEFPIAHGPLHVYGKRTLTSARQSGYELEGKVIIGGRKYRGFTSSQLFELPSGKLINAAIIHACGVLAE